MKTTLLTSWETLCAGQEAPVRTGHGTQTSSKLEKEYVNAEYYHPAYLYAKYIMWNVGMDES